MVEYSKKNLTGEIDVANLPKCKSMIYTWWNFTTGGKHRS
jgi:hypothetical protein